MLMLLYGTWKMKNVLDQVCVPRGVNAPKFNVNAIASLSSTTNLLHSDRKKKYGPSSQGKIQLCGSLTFNCIREANPINRSRLSVDYENLIIRPFISTETAPQQCLYEPSSTIVRTSFRDRRFP